MADLNFNSVFVALGDPVAQHRNLTEGILRNKGFRNNHLVRNTSELKNVLEKDGVDLLVCDLALPNNDLGDLIRQVRRGKLGSNPFLVTVTLVSDPTNEMIRACLDSGTDTVVLKPFSTDQLFKHITKVIKNRKPFVVTSDYIGPDRRKEERPGTQQIPKIEVPNFLRDKIKGELDAGKMKQNVDTVMKVINDQKLERNAFQIGWLAEKIVPIYSGSPSDDTVKPLISGLVRTSADQLERIKGLERANAEELCLALSELAGRLQENPLSPAQGDLEKLPGLAQEIKTLFNADPATA